MVTELLGLGGSGVLGALFSVITDQIRASHARKLEELKLKNAQEARLNGQVAQHLGAKDGFVAGPAYSISFLCIVATYCACCFLCLYYPSADLLTFNPDNEPRTVSLLWGLATWDINRTYVYSITTGGVGYALLHPLAFQIGTVITGLSPMKGR